MIIHTLTAPRTRATEALGMIAAVYGTPAYPGALARSDDDWQSEAVAQLAEAVAALLLDLPPRPGTRMRGREQPVP